jgi:hypothetical protein
MQFGSGFMGGIRRNGGMQGLGNRMGGGGGGGGGGQGQTYYMPNARGGPIRKKYARGGDVDVALMPGEAVIYPETAKKIGTSKLRQMNYADKRKGMAQGGVAIVPGTGRSDSVYTSLPEGSFVIRKDATSALGLNRQKYAKGDIVKPSTTKVGFAILKSKEQGSSYSVNSQQIISVANKAVKEQLSEILTKDRSNADYSVVRQGLNPKIKKKFDSAINSGLRSGVNSTIKKLSLSGEPFDGLPVPTVNKSNVDKFLSGINPGARGAFFEEILTAMSNNGVYSDSDPNRPFDFPKGLGKADKIFDKLKGIQYVDAKASTSAAKITGKKGSMASKIGSQIILEESGALSGIKSAKISPEALESKILSTLGSSKNPMGLTDLKKTVKRKIINYTNVLEILEGYKILKFKL